MKATTEDTTTQGVENAEATEDTEAAEATRKALTASLDGLGDDERMGKLLDLVIAEATVAMALLEEPVVEAIEADSAFFEIGFNSSPPWSCATVSWRPPGSRSRRCCFSIT